jgi:hypothetical protein
MLRGERMRDLEKSAESEEVLHDRFVRWQQISLQQLTYAINLLLALSGATIAFEITFSLDQRAPVVGVVKAALLSSMIFLAFSMLLGLFAVETRLYDFRYSSRIARLRWKSPERASDIARMEWITNALGKVTWCLFGMEIVTFGLGIILAVIVFFTVLAQ